MGRMKTPLCRIAYPYVFAPKVETVKDENTGQTHTIRKYQGALVFDSSADLTELKKEAIREGIAEFGENFEKLVKQGAIKWPFRDGGEININTGQPFYGEGLTFINVSSQDQPEVVSRYAEPGGTKPRRVTDPSELWPGEYCKASITIKPYNKPKSKGIGVYLNGLQIWHEGDRMDNRVSAVDDFDAEGEAPEADYATPPAHNANEDEQYGGGGSSLL